MPGRGRGREGRGGAAGRDQRQNGGNQNHNYKRGDARPRCGKCNKPGHKSEDCRTRTSNGDAMDVDSQQGRPVTCRKCNQVGHYASTCPTRGESSNGWQQSRSGDRSQGWCVFHARSGHNDVDCSDPKNPRGPNYKTAASHNSYVDYDSVNFATQQPYCPLCNCQSHLERDCIKKGLVDLRYNPQKCWKCGIKAHTGDECHNPTAQNACTKCRTSGHTTAACKDTSAASELRAKLYEQTAGWAAAAKVSRFTWDPSKTRIHLSPLQVEQQFQKQQLDLAYANGYHVTDEDRRIMQERLARVAAQGGYATHSQSAPPTHWVNVPRPQPTHAAHIHCQSEAKDLVAAAAVNSIDFSLISHLPVAEQKFFAQCVYEASIKQQDDHQRRVHAHCERSTRMYKKENYRQWINDHSGDLLQSRILGSDKYYLALKFRLNQGLQLWRDPQALRAISQKQKPNCNTCHHDGEFWDGMMRNIPVHTDALELEDFQDWGVFVAFDCQCCNKEASYSYVSRPSYELVGADCGMGGC